MVFVQQKKHLKQVKQGKDISNWGLVFVVGGFLCRRAQCKGLREFSLSIVNGASECPRRILHFHFLVLGDEAAAESQGWASELFRICYLLQVQP